MPADLEKFLCDYKYSKFVECTKYIENKMQAKMLSKNSKLGTTNIKIHSIKQGFMYMKFIFENLKKPYWIAAGTLLGS